MPSLTAKNLMALGSKGPLKASELQGIIEEGTDGRAVSEKIYIDPEDPKKKKYDELKKKALLMTKKTDSRRNANEDASDTASLKSGASKQSESQMSLGSVSAGTTSSVAGPFLTHARAARSEAPPSMRAVTPTKSQSEGLNSFKAEFAAMMGKPTQRERSYSPIYKCRNLKDDDPDEVYDERVAEIALEMDMAMEYLGDLTTFFKKREDIAILENCEQIAEEAIDEHIDLVDKVYAIMCAENDLADL